MLRTPTVRIVDDINIRMCRKVTLIFKYLPHT